MHGYVYGVPQSVRVSKNADFLTRAKIERLWTSFEHLNCPFTSNIPWKYEMVPRITQTIRKSTAAQSTKIGWSDFFEFFATCSQGFATFG